MKSTLVIASLVLLAGTAACALPFHRQQSRRDHSLITREQIDQHKFNSAFDAVQSLHSNWLQPRGTDSFNTPSIVLVYYDNVRMGGVETLRAIHARTVDHIRHHNGVDATARWGVGHSAGVIFVSTHTASATVR